MADATLAGQPFFVGTPVASAATSPVLFDGLFRFDMQDGGRGRIIGTVKEKNTPANTPLRRRVILQTSRDKRTIRETWSDAVTGAYVFESISENQRYDVISYDHTGAYRAVVADNLTPELMT